MRDLQQLELALKIAAETIVLTNTEIVDCPAELNGQSWKCEREEGDCSSVEQQATCWEKFFLEQADKVLKQSEDVVLEEIL
jgi:hypothetical protein